MTSVGSSNGGGAPSGGSWISLQMLSCLDRLSRLPETARLVLCVAGIFVCYLVFGIFQEKVTRGSFGEHHERFTYATGLVFCQCLVGCLFAGGVLQIQPDVPNNAPAHLFAICSSTYVLAMITSNKALEYIAYPVQVLLKACKPISVLLLGVLLAGKRYSAQRYACVFLIVIGVGIFMYPSKDRPPKEVGSETFGVALLALSLVFDGLVGAVQEKINVFRVTSFQLMYATNAYGFAYLFAALLISGEGIAFGSFLARYPYVIWDIVGFSFVSALGQSFVFLTITNFGPLVCSLATTLRKFTTILLSIVLFGNHLIGRQWLAVFIVFFALLLESLSKRKKATATHLPGHQPTSSV
eukprot:scpid25556/ scgid2293/ Solute carrier family 35 member B1 homolog